MRRWTLAMVLLLTAAPLDAQRGPTLTDVRERYLAAVEDEDAINPAMDAIRHLRQQGNADAALLMAYEGALTTLRAKHGFWPPRRLMHLNDGLYTLDQMVAEHPDHVEIRYLRLMSCFYLPGLLGRTWSVDEDLDALATLLPDVADRYAPDLYETVVRFVLENAELDRERRAALERALRDHG
ncbi:MAG TPA: hypothetical protein VK966_06505 [Longimicrobiales bacterium]|nr:hypothetical protein [Longimicrobiales bacterium]